MEARFGRKAIFNAALLSTGANVASYAGGMVVSILIARSLGPADYGQYAYVVWLSGLMVSLCAGGFNNTAMRFISEFVGRSQAQVSMAIHRRLRWLLLVVVAASTGVLVVAWPWVKPQAGATNVPLLLTIALVAFTTKAVFMFESSAAKGYGRFWVEAVCLSTLSVLNVIGVVVLWQMHADLGRFLIWFAVLNIAHMVMVGVLARRQAVAADATGHIDAELALRIRNHLGWGVVLACVAVLASRSFETFLLNTSAGPKEVAYFTIAVVLTRSGVDLLVGGLSSVLIPVMSHAFGAGGQERLRKVFVESARYYQIVGFTLAGLGYFWAEPAVILMYGEMYRPVVLALQVLVVGVCLSLTSGALTGLLSATENQKLRVSFTVLSVATSALLAFTLVPKYGLKGALISVTASQWIVFGVTVVMVDRWVGFRLPYAALARQTLVALLALALAWGCAQAIGGIVGSAVAGAVYLVVFGVASVLGGIWTPKELDAARSQAARLPGLRWLAQPGA